MVRIKKNHAVSPFGLYGVRVMVPAFAALSLATPLYRASADPYPSPSPSGSASASAAPASVPVSAAAFAGQSAVPSEEAWRSAEVLTGVRMGREARDHQCSVTHVSEWVRIHCADLSTGRVDLLAGEARDVTFFPENVHRYSNFGEDMGVQFSMRPGDRRVIQWAAADVWWSVWQGDEGKMASGMQVMGPMFGMVAQIDWASGPEPVIVIY